MEKYYRLLKENWLNLLITLYIFFVVYSTIVPFNFINSWDYFFQRLGQVDWIPFRGKHRLIARSDVVANVLFFIPLGILLSLRKILKYYRNFLVSDWIHILLVGFSVSLMVEFSQLFTFDRHTSITDLLANTLGNLLGAVLMFIIYLKFHVQIKYFLYYLFVHKPEMSISAIFLIFICISYSIPFTFQPSYISIKASFRNLIGNQFQWQNFLFSLSAQIILFSTFSYLLILGVYRYFSEFFRSYKVYLLIIAVAFIPLLLEIFQLLIPIRNHALSDIVAAEIGILLGLIFFLIQKYSRLAENDSMIISDKNYLQSHIEFFQFLAVVYLFYIYSYFTFYKPLYTSAGNFYDLFRADLVKDFQILKSKRLDLFIHFTKEVFTFLPAGFILSLLLLELKSWWKVGIFLAILVAIILLGVFLSASFSFSMFFMFLSLSATILGFWLGYVSWEVYKYLMKF